MLVEVLLQIFKISSGFVHFIEIFSFQMFTSFDGFIASLENELLQIRDIGCFRSCVLSTKPKSKYSSLYCLPGAARVWYCETAAPPVPTLSYR